MHGYFSHFVSSRQRYRVPRLDIPRRLSRTKNYPKQMHKCHSIRNLSPSSLKIMAASTALLQFLPPTKLFKFLNHTSAIQSDSLIHHRFSLQKNSIIIKCTSNPTPPPPPPSELDSPDPQPMLSQPETEEENQPDRSSELDFPDPQSMISQPETEEENQPDRFEIEKRSKFAIFLKKPKPGFLEKLENLMDKGVFGSKELLAKTGEIVAEKAREEAEVLREEGQVDERLITELDRVLKLMEMDLAMVKASVKEETLKQSVEQDKVRCRQAILVANSF